MIEAIVKTLKSAFPKNKIYTESVEQGLKVPCFSILPLSANGNRHVGNRYKNTYQFMVQYFSSEADVFEDCSKMLGNLLILLADVGKYHAVKLNGEIVDGILHFEVVYSEFVDVLTPADSMGDYKHTVNGGIVHE